VIKPVVEAMGFSVVELRVGRSRRLSHVTLVVYRASGLDADDLSKINRIIRPHLEAMKELEYLAFVVSSPGLGRKIKSREEYAIFRGRGVKILLKDHSDWIGGVIEGADNKSLRLSTPQGKVEMDMENIRNAKLDHTQDEGNLNYVR